MSLHFMPAQRSSTMLSYAAWVTQAQYRLCMYSKEMHLLETVAGYLDFLVLSERWLSSEGRTEVS
eukprot:scaffold82477_cov18-Prasinocladus_malaysianus.AAC.1